MPGSWDHTSFPRLVLHLPVRAAPSYPGLTTGLLVDVPLNWKVILEGMLSNIAKIPGAPHENIVLSPRS